MCRVREIGSLLIHIPQKNSRETIHTLSCPFPLFFFFFSPGLGRYMTIYTLYLSGFASTWEKAKFPEILNILASTLLTTSESLGALPAFP